MHAHSFSVTAQDREAARYYYDKFGSKESERLSKDIAGRVAAEVHKSFLQQYMKPGARVLEIGAGPGRFTKELAELGATIVVTDISPVQLELNREYISSTSAEKSVERRELLDVCDTSRFKDNEFDMILAYGGPLSYAFEETQETLGQLLRITKEGGHVVGSVMSTLGIWRHKLAGVVEAAEAFGEDVNDLIIKTGDLRHNPEAAHMCKMFRAQELGAMISLAGGRILGMSASNWASLGDIQALTTLEANPERWEHFLMNEINACTEPGALDGGTHILFAYTHE